LFERVKKSILGEKNLKLIYNGIDTTIFKRKNKTFLRKKYGLPIDKKIILTLASGGKYNSQKGWEHSEKIIKNLLNQNILFINVGGAQQTKFCGDNKLFIPYITDINKVADYYSLSDLFLFTSNYENFPLTILEAMASGLPVAAFNVGGVKEQIIDGKNGIITEMGEYDLMTNNIIKYLGLNTETKERISTNASDYVRRNFSLKQMVNNYERLYLQTIK
jgi:glycosyltransferase involved in cell wall biosynthesis